MLQAETLTVASHCRAIDMCITPRVAYKQISFFFRGQTNNAEMETPNLSWENDADVVALVIHIRSLDRAFSSSNDTFTFFFLLYWRCFMFLSTFSFYCRLPVRRKFNFPAHSRSVFFIIKNSCRIMDSVAPITGYSTFYSLWIVDSVTSTTKRDKSVTRRQHNWLVGSCKAVHVLRKQKSLYIYRLIIEEESGLVILFFFTVAINFFKM